MIKKSGDTFTGLVTKKRPMKAKLLLQTTELPISSIHQMVGILNKTFFYKKFKEEYGQLPSDVRTSNTTHWVCLLLSINTI
ncbi:helix-turn-helix domain-containing protein [Alkalibacterium sp. MB6]|uniref:helix-turn-helix domain-containing protein n=1 Tax=Alkalibacterium sp. MB6 TaxID=2081965 RepID=UPI002351AD5F|nr:helix-turn-helix domain-containing protein [Alkalibacterium sp. MB6]